MNCKPGDLAIQIGAYNDIGMVNIGNIYKCISFYIDTDKEPRWILNNELECDDKFLIPIDGGESIEESIKAMLLLTNIQKKETA